MIIRKRYFHRVKGNCQDRAWLSVDLSTTALVRLRVGLRLRTNLVTFNNLTDLDVNDRNHYTEIFPP